MNLLSITIYELKRILRNRRLMLLVISQPIVIALIIGLLANHDPDNIKVGLINIHHNQYSNEIESKLSQAPPLTISSYDSADDNLIKQGKLMSFIVIDLDESGSGNIEVRFNPTGRFIKSYIVEEVANAIKDTSIDVSKKEIAQEIAGLPINVSVIPNNEFAPITLTTSDATPYNLKFFDYYASAMMVLLILLVVANLSGISITSERVSGTFERLSVTPYSKIDIVLGKAVALFLIGLAVGIFGISSLFLMFHIAIGSIWLLILLYSLVVATAVTLGLLVSVVTFTVTESVQLAMYLFFISVLSTGIFSPVEVAWKYFPYFMKINPFYYAVDASRRINMLGATWIDVANNIYILGGFFITFLILAIILLKREAK